MPTFDTPEPISVDVELVVGELRIIAGERSETVVDVRPGDPSVSDDVKAANETRVEFEAGRLVVHAAKGWRHYTPFGTGGTVAVAIEVPAGSQVAATLSVGNAHAGGPLGACRLKTAMGNLSVEDAGELHLKTSHGNITVDRGTGLADLHSGSGRIRIGEIDGPLVVRNSNGDTRVGEVTGDLRVKSANGDIAVGRAPASVMARTASGDIRIGEVVRGVVSLRTAAGELEVGIGAGTAAWLDVNSGHGRVRNDLDITEGPDAGDDTVEVRARTGMGDIVIHRSHGEHVHRPARGQEWT
jgi:DUF4097 and DUF4098 domain-containing protein YvlB